MFVELEHDLVVDWQSSKKSRGLETDFSQKSSFFTGVPRGPLDSGHQNSKNMSYFENL